MYLVHVSQRRRTWSPSKEKSKYLWYLGSSQGKKIHNRLCINILRCVLSSKSKTLSNNPKLKWPQNTIRQHHKKPLNESPMNFRLHRTPHPRRSYRDDRTRNTVHPHWTVVPKRLKRTLGSRCNRYYSPMPVQDPSPRWLLAVCMLRCNHLCLKQQLKFKVQQVLLSNAGASTFTPKPKATTEIQGASGNSPMPVQDYRTSFHADYLQSPVLVQLCNSKCKKYFYNTCTFAECVISGFHQFSVNVGTPGSSSRPDNL